VNVSGLLGLFDAAMGAYGAMIGEFEEIQDEIDEYEFFEEER
jgi:hypothetical protein